MKQKFSTSWNASAQPRKQRKFLHNAPHHAKNKLMSAHLSDDLRKQHKKRSMPVRENDIVKIMKGNFRGKTGKVTSVSTIKLAAYVEGAEKTKKDGTKTMIPIKASNLLIIELHTQDNRRLNKNA